MVDSQELKHKLIADFERFQKIPHTVARASKMWTEVVIEKYDLYREFFHHNNAETQNEYLLFIKDYDVVLSREKKLLGYFGGLLHEELALISYHEKSFQDFTSHLDRSKRRETKKEVSYVKDILHDIKTYLEQVDSLVQKEDHLIQSYKHISPARFSEKLKSFQHQFRNNWMDMFALAQKHKVHLERFESRAYDNLSHDIRHALEKKGLYKRMAISSATLGIIGVVAASFLQEDAASASELLYFYSAVLGLFFSVSLSSVGEIIHNKILIDAKHKYYPID